MRRPRRRPTRSVVLAGTAALVAVGLATPTAAARELPDHQPAVLEHAPPGIDLPLSRVTDTAYDQAGGRLFVAGTDAALASGAAAPLVYDVRTGTLTPLVGAEGATDLSLDVPGRRLVAYDDRRIEVFSLDTLILEDAFEVDRPCEGAVPVGSLLLCVGASAVDLSDGERIDHVPMIKPDGERARRFSGGNIVADPAHEGIVFVNGDEYPGYLYRARVGTDDSGSPVFRQQRKRSYRLGFNDVEVSPDGSSVFFAGATVRVRELDARTLRTTRVLETFNHFDHIAVSPEGRVVAASSDPGSFDLYPPTILLYGHGQTQTAQAWWMDPDEDPYNDSSDDLQRNGLQMARDQIFAVSVGPSNDDLDPQLRVIPTRRPTVVALEASRHRVSRGSPVWLTAQVSPPMAGRSVVVRGPGFPRRELTTDRWGQASTRVRMNRFDTTFLATVPYTDRYEGSRAVTTVDVVWHRH